MHRAPLFLSFICFTSCQPSFQIKVKNGHGYTVSDTMLTRPERYMPFDAEAGYYICYIGPDTGRIAIGKPLRRYNIRDTHSCCVAHAFGGNEMTIRVDTAATQIQIEHFSLNHDTAGPYRITDSIVPFRAMMVTLQNVSDAAIYLGSHNFLQYIWLEIRNGKNEWIQLEKPSAWNSYCGTGALHHYLHPRDILIAKFPQYEGEYQADYRLVWQMPDQPKIISNEFVAPVNSFMLNVVELQMDRPRY